MTLKLENIMRKWNITQKKFWGLAGGHISEQGLTHGFLIGVANAKLGALVVQHEKGGGKRCVW